MSRPDQDDSDKRYDPTPQKLEKARVRGEVALSNDLSVAASYAGFVIAAVAVGAGAISAFGTTLSTLLDQPDRLALHIFDGPTSAPLGGLVLGLFHALVPWFAIPFAVVLISLLGQRAIVFAPTKLTPKLSRISPLSNARNKFGRSGFFEFFKSFAKLVLYSICLGLFLNARLPEMVGAVASGPRIGLVLMAEFCIDFMLLALLIASGLGIIDFVWQKGEHRRKNMMSHKELADETKESEGDPHLKQHRRFRAQALAGSQMMAAVPKADVVIVNPTHFAVALKWDRRPGTAPVCVAKGVDELAAAIRTAAQGAGVPIHHDPVTARALHATVDINQEIAPDHYAPVAAAIRFAEDMRRRARSKAI